MEIDSLIQDTSIPGLRVVTTGPLPPNPAELLGSRRMQEILSQLRHEADIIIIDSPPISAVSDALILTSLADAVLLVVKSGKTSRTLARKAISILHQVKAQVIGSVYNGVAEYDSDYTYDYTYTYYDNEPVEAPRPTYTNGYAYSNGNGIEGTNDSRQTNGVNYANGHTNNQHYEDQPTGSTEYPGAASSLWDESVYPTSSYHEHDQEADDHDDLEMLEHDYLDDSSLPEERYSQPLLPTGNDTTQTKNGSSRMARYQ